eukprot:3978020-Pyramimonas_sp.AAC.1
MMTCEPNEAMPEHDYGSETTNIIMIAFSDIVHEQTHAKLALSTTDTLTTPKRVTHLIRPGRNATLNRRLIFVPYQSLVI